MKSVIKNPIFISFCLLFWVNQLLEKVFYVFIPIVHSYLDDFLAIPVILGITLQVYRWLHPEKENFVFTKTQVIVGVAYFAILFEVLLPLWSPIYTPDIWDVVLYAIGGIIFFKDINYSADN